MKKISGLLIMLVLFTGCGKEQPKVQEQQKSQEKQEVQKKQEPQENQVPKNRKDISSSTIKENEEPMDEVQKIEAELSSANESGVVVSIEKDGYKIQPIVTETQTDEDGEEGMLSYGANEELIFKVTEKTEYKVTLYNSISENSRIVAGSQADIQQDSFVSLYGSYSGKQFIATKVIILKNE